MRFVFTLTTGRTGTRTLAALLGANLPGARVHHERLGARVRGVHTPSIPTLLAFNHRGSVEEVQAFWKRKWAAIADQPSHTWVETSHLLLKAGLVPALDHLDAEDQIHLVALRRDRRSLLQSFMRLQDFRRRGNRLQWYLDELAPRNLVPLSPDLAGSAMGLALWYILETEARVALARRQVARDPRIVVHDLVTHQLGDADAVFPLLQALVPDLSADRVHIPPRLNASHTAPLDDALLQSIDQLVARVADFDAEAHVDTVLARRPTPFATLRSTRRVAPQPGRTPLRFIGSPGRSGSTLAVDLLGCHPRLSPVYETAVVPEIVQLLGQPLPPARLADTILQRAAAWVPTLTNPRHSKFAHEHYLHGPHHLKIPVNPYIQAASQLAAAVQRGAPVDAALAVFLRSIFDAHARADRAPEWINKTPANVVVAPMLLTLLPTAKLLVTVRDPRDVALSVRSKPWGPNTVEDVPAWWMGIMQKALVAKELAPDRVHFVRYEDMLCSPRATLDRMQDFFDLPRQSDAILARRAAAGITLATDRIGRWRTELTAEQAHLIGAQLGDQLDRFGYAPSR